MRAEDLIGVTFGEGPMHHYFNPASASRIIAVGDPNIRMKIYWRPHATREFLLVEPPDGMKFGAFPVFRTDEVVLYSLALEEVSPGRRHYVLAKISLDRGVVLGLQRIAQPPEKRIAITDLLCAGPPGKVYAELSDIPRVSGPVRHFVAIVDVNEGTFVEVES